MGNRNQGNSRGDWGNEGLRGGRNRVPCLDRIYGARSKEDTQSRRNEGGKESPSTGKTGPSQMGLT